jgi:ribosomal protein L13
MADKYTQAAEFIIDEQRLVVGPLALDIAKKINGLSFIENGHPGITGNPKNVLSQLVAEYSKLFGRASVEVSKSVLRKHDLLFGPGELPEILV